MRRFLLSTCCLAVLTVSACVRTSILALVSAGDFSIVKEGRYEGQIRIQNGVPEIERLVRPWRQEIEAHPDFLRQIAAKYFSLPETSEFGYMYVAYDSLQHRVVLRYFAYDPKPVIFAGWQIQFVFDAGSRRLVEVLTAEVPLE